MHLIHAESEDHGQPVQPGKATLSLTGETIGHCTLAGAPSGVSLVGIKALNLPYGVTISSAKGFPVTIAGRSSARLSFEATVSYQSTNYTCVFTARKATAHASNTGNKVTLAKQELTLDGKKSAPLCSQIGVSSATYSGTYGPIRDTSVKHSPKVFFN